MVRHQEKVHSLLGNPVLQEGLDFRQNVVVLLFRLTLKSPEVLEKTYGISYSQVYKALKANKIGVMLRKEVKKLTLRTIVTAKATDTAVPTQATKSTDGIR